MNPRDAALKNDLDKIRKLDRVKAGRCRQCNRPRKTSPSASRCRACLRINRRAQETINERRRNKETKERTNQS